MNTAPRIEQSRFAKLLKLRRVMFSVAILAIVVLGGIVLVNVVIASARFDPSKGISRNMALELWSAGRYDELIEGTSAELKNKGQDPFFSLMQGFAFFYKASALPNGEEKMNLTDESIIAIRKALVSGNNPLTPEAHYVLGKAYFRKGRYYLDLCAKHLEKARELGVMKADLPEYLAIAWFQLDRADKSVACFEEALKQDANDSMLLAAAEANYKASKADRGDELIRAVINRTKDEEMELKARLMLAETFVSRGAWDLAENELTRIIEKKQTSAEAYFLMGMVYSGRGDPIKARAEWRKAVRINPNHALARQKLSS